MNNELRRSLRRAKNLLASVPEVSEGTSKETLQDFDDLVLEARNYLVTKLADPTTSLDELEIEIKFSVGDAEVSFEYKD